MRVEAADTDTCWMDAMVSKPVAAVGDLWLRLDCLGSQGQGSDGQWGIGVGKGRVAREDCSQWCREDRLGPGGSVINHPTFFV